MHMEIDNAKLNQADDLAEINQRIGHTIGILQSLEDISAYYFVLKVQASKGMGSLEGTALIERACKETFGATISKIRNAKLLDEDLQKRFDNIKNERNWLVHRSLNSRYQAMENYGALLKLMDRLNTIVRDAKELMARLVSEAELFVLADGIDPSQIEIEASRIRDSWANPDAH